MLNKTLFMHQHYFSFRFHSLLDVASMLSSLIDRQRRPIRIKFLTLQGKPNSHVWGTKSPTQHFPFLSGSWIGVTLLDYRVRLPCTRMLAAWERCAMFKEGETKVHSLGRSSTLLTDYHISRHVASTFKRLTELPHISTLASFVIHRRGLIHINSPWPRPSSL